MRYVTLMLAGLIMTGDVHAEENRVTVRGLSQRLQLTGWQASWPVHGEIVTPVHPLPGGKILAAVRSGQDAELDLVLWDKEGHELGRGPVGVRGEVKAAQVFGSRLIVASNAEVAEIDTNTLHKGRVRSFVAATGKATLYRPSPSGLWLIDEKAVSYFDLDGRAPVEKARPLLTPDKPACPVNWGEAKQPCTCGLQPEETTAIVSEAGDLLLVEGFKEIYPYGDLPGISDEVRPSTATVLDTKGRAVAQKALAWMKKTREWFYSGARSPQDPTGLPRWGGLVRNRRETERSDMSLPFAARGRGFLFWSMGSGYDDRLLFQTDEHLEKLWKSGVCNLDEPTASPAWTSPLLFHDNVCQKFLTIRDGGSKRGDNTIPIREILLELERTKYKHPRFAIGQSSEGDWLLIAY